MPKRKRASTAGRKKQAVTITRSAATKAIIQRNASTSPLLKLPAEIREEILSLVVGRQFIHLDCIHRRHIHRPRIFRHAICTAPSSEYEAHEQFMTGYTHIPTDDSANFYSPTFRKRHAHCEFRDLEDVEERRKPMLDLRILGACGQIYEEANAILWTTNTFSFEDGPSLHEFIQGLHTTQRNTLTRMHIDVAWEMIWADWWRTSLLPSIVSKFNALQTLHLTFKQCRYITPSRFPQEALNLLSAMQTLALKNVTVVIGDRLDSPDSEDSDDPDEHRWTIEQKRQAAEGLRSSLLNR